ncbi:hypothetical protein B0H13DRAFT_2302418 [Mycena leptocephala]|nr:hypothetical protein B0H13DRAFT_2302418 [Mycena leptocephala]
MTNIALKTASSRNLFRILQEWYHPSTRIVFPDLGKDIKLTDQTTEVRTVITDAIKVIKVRCILVDAYPVLRSKMGYAKTQMLKVARGKPEAAHIMQRLDSDPRFSRWLGNLICHISPCRQAKKFAGIVVPGLYRFAHLEPASVKVLVEDLIENDKYIFPVIPITGQVNINSPYHHPAIIKLIKEGRFTGNFAARNAKYFTSSHPKKLDELEVLHLVPTLAATAVSSSAIISTFLVHLQIYSALCEYQLTGTRQNIKFTENVYEDSYRHHQASLACSRNTAPTSTAWVMHAIYKDVTAANVKTILTSTSMLINLVEVPDSD